jgi:RNA polymerase sigma-70 factor, ECF subfamily
VNLPGRGHVWLEQGSAFEHGDPTIIGETRPAPNRTPPDADLLRRMADEDDVDAFEALFDRYRVPVFRAALALTGDPSAAEEVLMDTFSRAYSHRRGLDTARSPLPWLHKVAANLCYTRLGRRRLPSEPVTELVANRLADSSAPPDLRAEHEEMARIVREGIARLSEKHQSVVILYYLDGCSLQETADLLGLPLGTVKSRIHHALRDLRGRLDADRRFVGVWGTFPIDEAEESR